MTVFSADFETRSAVDIRTSGAYRYAEDPSTDVLCFAYAWDDEEPDLWLPGMPVPERVYDDIHQAEIRAWNAAFERLIWRNILGPRYGWPVPALEQYVDTAAEAAAMGLPRKLEDAAAVLKVPHQKDAEGARIMQQVSKPRRLSKKNTEPWWTPENAPEKFERLYAYCQQDVRTERAVAARLRRLSPFERQVYLLDQRVNDRGVLLDVPLIQAAQKAVAVGQEGANRRLAAVTGGAVRSVTKVADLTAWAQARGAEVTNIRKDTVRDALKLELPEDLREAFELRQDAGRSALAKLPAMLKCMCADEAARGLLLYHAAGTGRWAGRLIQPQNFARPTVKHPERFIPSLLAGEYDLIDLEQGLLAVVSSLLRACFIARPGTRFLAGDYSQIEARVLAWIAEQDDLVHAFATGGKIYEAMAARIYGVPASEIAKDDPRRQTGKVTVLGAGYQMGAATFEVQTKVQWDIDLTDEESEAAITAYREMNDRIRAFWPAINRAAMQAVRRPGAVYACGREDKIRFVVRGQFLWCILPSGRPLAYALPSVVSRKVEITHKREDGTEWVEKTERPQLRAWGVNSMTRRWQPYYLYGGLLTENVVQAMARDLLAAAMLRTERAGYPNLLTVHDELVAEVPEGQGSLDEFLTLMKRLPKWAAGLPVDVEGWEGDRYRK